MDLEHSQVPKIGKSSNVWWNVVRSVFYGMIPISSTRDAGIEPVQNWCVTIGECMWWSQIGGLTLTMVLHEEPCVSKRSGQSVSGQFAIATTWPNSGPASSVHLKIWGCKIIDCCKYRLKNVHECMHACIATFESIYLSVYLSIDLSIYRSIDLSIYLSISLYLAIYLSI